MTTQLPRLAESGGKVYDVLVAGGGMAGIAAAIAAGRAGASTILVENAGWLGGMGITGATGLHSFYNVFDVSPPAAPMRTVAGVAQQLVDLVGQLGGGVGHVRMQRGGDFVSMLTPVEPETFKLAAARMCRQANVELLLHSLVEQVHAADGRVQGVVVANKAGRILLRAAQYVDCTGDGDLAAWAGAPFVHFKPGDRGAYSAGFTFRLCNLDLAALEADLEARGLIVQLAHAVKSGANRPDLVRLGIDMKKLRSAGLTGGPEYFLSSSLRPRELTYCNCINFGPNDGLDPAALAEAEVNLRGRMFEVAEFFRSNFAGCRDCYPAGPAPSVGQRRGRAIRCDYELSADDCTTGRRFDDQIGCFGFIDNWQYSVADAGAYGIPYQALIPRRLDNVLVAGRMMSVELVAHNSTRNTACCLVCGQAAGTAAAMAAAKSVAPRDLSVAALQTALRADGALLEPRPEKL